MSQHIFEGATSFKSGTITPGGGFILSFAGLKITRANADELGEALEDHWLGVNEDDEWGQIAPTAVWIPRPDMLEDHRELNAIASIIAADMGAEAVQAWSVQRCVGDRVHAELLRI